ncbi:MAG: aldehyde dehydrogenase family protein [Planctomycetes bacterium]|jgi:acyl-CoA reductase-like NAD-dependent aldehyde dehydrogenase|nr:aldehyde dehydrogenase family protein [Planctomycetota bacterium]
MTVPVPKTYKLYVGGKFPRSESGRSYQPAGNPALNVARGSRKDLRDAVQAARAGLAAWSGSTAYLRGQVLYRLAEMLESRREAMQQELLLGGASKAAAGKELDTAIALTIWYAGLCDKVQSLLGSQNAVQGPFFNFSTVEPCGVVGVIAPAAPSLVGTLALVLPLLVGGNAVVALVSEPAPFVGLALGEVCASSDIPAGAINLLSGLRSELAPQFAAHRDIDALLIAGAPDAALTAAAADNCKRVRYCDLPTADWTQAGKLRSLQFVEPFVELKTLWHPVAP